MMSLREVARVLAGDVSGNHVLAPGPSHSPQDRSLQVMLDANAPDGFLVHSFAGDDAIACKDYVRAKLGLPPWNGKANGSVQAKTLAATYDYLDEVGELLFQVLRYEPKGFSQRRPNGKDKWIWSLGETRRVLYRLPELAEPVAAGRTVYIAEGEKGVDALAALDVPATCSPHGAGKWRDEYSKHLAGADVVILPDNDEPGELHARSVAKSLHGSRKGARSAIGRDTRWRRCLRLASCRWRC